MHYSEEQIKQIIKQKQISASGTITEIIELFTAIYEVHQRQFNLRKHAPKFILGGVLYFLFMPSPLNGWLSLISFGFWLSLPAIAFGVLTKYVLPDGFLNSANYDYYISINPVLEWLADMKMDWGMVKVNTYLDLISEDEKLCVEKYEDRGLIGMVGDRCKYGYERELLNCHLDYSPTQSFHINLKELLQKFMELERCGQSTRWRSSCSRTVTINIDYYDRQMDQQVLEEYIAASPIAHELSFKQKDGQQYLHFEYLKLLQNIDDSVEGGLIMDKMMEIKKVLQLA